MNKGLQHSNLNFGRIAIIIPYFGKWPEWINLYFYSCEQNKFIDWYFFTDCPQPVKHGENLKFYAQSFEEYCQGVSTKLGIGFCPKSPYKLCDLRPFYAHIHKDIVSNYEFWGYGDVDVIWGDMKTFYAPRLLSKYDIFSTHADRLSGHLAVIRNKPRYTELCFKIKDWKKKLSADSNYALDEIDFSRLLYPESKCIIKLYLKVIRKIFIWRDAWVIYYNLMPLINSILFLKLRKLYFKEQHTTPMLSDDGLTYKHDADTWYYKDGKVFNNKTKNEYIYLHFMIFKKNAFRKDYFWKNDFYLMNKVENFSNVVISKHGITNDN